MHMFRNVPSHVCSTHNQTRLFTKILKKSVSNRTEASDIGVLCADSSKPVMLLTT